MRVFCFVAAAAAAPATGFHAALSYARTQRSGRICAFVLGSDRIFCHNDASRGCSMVLVRVLAAFCLIACMTANDLSVSSLWYIYVCVCAYASAVLVLVHVFLLLLMQLRNEDYQCVTKKEAKEAYLLPEVSNK